MGSKSLEELSGVIQNWVRLLLQEWMKYQGIKNDRYLLSPLLDDRSSDVCANML